MRKALLAIALSAGLLAGVSSAGGPAWDISGTWIGFVGDLTLTQSGEKLAGTFKMKSGCTELYTASGTISGSYVTLALQRASGPGDNLPCAGTQTLSGSVDSSGTALLLKLSNAFMTSPADRFTGTAKKLGTETTTTTVAAGVKSYAVLVSCTGRKQLCPQAYTVSVDAPAGTLVAQFTTSSGHCSDVRVFVSVDGGPERVSAFLGPRKSTPAYAFDVKAGRHQVKVRAEGRRGGCNTGYLGRWGGTLRIRTGG